MTKKFICPVCNNNGNGAKISAPVTGKILRYLVKEGSKVKSGDDVLIIESMKMEMPIKATGSGEIHFPLPAGTQVKSADIIATIDGCSCCGQISNKILNYPNLTVSIMGLYASAKTSYLTVMLNELKESVKYLLEFRAENRIAKDNFHYKKLYKDGWCPNVTSDCFDPQIWSVQTLSKKKENYSLTIYDTMEEWYDPNFGSSFNNCPFISASHAFIITIDPLQLSSINKGGFVDQTIIKNSLSDRADTNVIVDFISKLANYLRSLNRLSPSNNLDIPVAVVFTKIDTLLSHKSFDRYNFIKDPGPSIQNGKVAMDEIKKIDEEICHWLNDMGEDIIIRALSSNFNNFCLFGVSNYGQVPNGLRLSLPLKPHRVLDPVLWLFKQVKFLD